MAHKISFQPVGRRGQCAEDASLLDCAHQAGVGILGICGGRGQCCSCKVQIMEGTVSPPTTAELETFSSEEIADGWRLACQVFPASDVKVHVPPESMTTPQRLQVEGVEIKVPPNPPVRAYHLKLAAPSLTDLTADDARLLAALAEQHSVTCRSIDIEVLRDLSPRLRSWDWDFLASVRGDEVIAVSPWPTRELGLAVDLGSTKVAAYLVDLTDGKSIASKGMMNPQISCGEDIISRITRVITSPDEGAHLQEMAVDAINQLAGELCAEVKAKPEEIVESVVVGNTAMHHIFLRLPVGQLTLAPFVPAASDSLDIKARDVGLKLAPGAYVHLLPNIAGFVGADHVADLLSTGAWQSKKIAIIIDIGTNTEISLIDGEITSASCASGPAFEGGHINDGMRASSGAIERLRIADGEVQYQTIDNAPPVGICGSGVLDAIAQLYLAGILDEGGKMSTNHPRVRTGAKYLEFVIAPERDGHPAVVFTQQDVRELQLAKAAIRAAIQILLETRGRREEEIEEVVIAGAFGSYIDVSSAIAIGMLPVLPLDRFRQVGNAAGMGARLALVSTDKRKEAGDIARRMRYVELATAPDFMKTFIQACALGKYRMVQGKREEIK